MCKDFILKSLPMQLNKALLSVIQKKKNAKNEKKAVISLSSWVSAQINSSRVA